MLKEKIRLAEYFVGFQGEGVTQGKLSVFIRFYGCPLSCQFCDSKFSWKNGVMKFTEYDTAELLKTIDKVGHVVFTGGEPLLAGNQKIMTDIILKTSEQTTYEIETSGILKADYLLDVLNNGSISNSRKLSHITFNVSPKINVSQEKINNYSDDLDPILIHDLMKIDSLNFIVKCLFNDYTDLVHIKNLQKEYELPNYKMYVQPKGTKSSEVLELIRKYYDDIIDFGFNLSPRLHVLIFEDKKGV